MNTMNTTALPTDGTQAAPTHRCTECGALWRLWHKEETGADSDSWNLRSAACGKCCDMAPMGKQIVPLTIDDMRRALSRPVDPNHDLVPTLRMFGGVMTDKAADAIEQLRIEVRQADARGDDALRRTHAAEALNAELLEALDSCAGTLQVFVDDGSAAPDSVIGKNAAAARALIERITGSAA